MEIMQEISNVANQLWGKAINVWWPAYYAWVAEKLNGTNPFVVLSFSVVIVFVLMAYLWYRHSDRI